MWALASRDSSHVGNAGVGVASMKSALVAVDAEQLALTEHSFDTALDELGVVARGKPCLIVADFNGEPTQILFLSGGISAGLWVGLQAAWAFARGSQHAIACKRTWGSPGGNRRDFVVGCPLAAAAVRSRKVDPGRWSTSHLAVRAYVDCQRWT